jgi:NAD(P)-dependent dehydrogenase (short-subunit alcohol dehydrogenase family)
MTDNKKTAVVTGGTRGIGFAIAKRLLVDGYKVIVTGTSSESNFPNGAEYHKVNFNDSYSIEGFIKYLNESKIDILINNAGITKIDRVENIDINDFDNIINVNLRAPLLLSQCVIPHMKKQKWGRIVNISSIFGKISKEYRASYSASKFGLVGMTKALSAELSEYNILVNSIGPGFIDTDLTRSVLGVKGIQNLSKQIPMKRLGNVNEISALVSWLISDQNTYLTSQNIIIDGGFSSV